MEIVIKPYSKKKKFKEIFSLSMIVKLSLHCMWFASVFFIVMGQLDYKLKLHFEWDSIKKDENDFQITECDSKL